MPRKLKLDDLHLILLSTASQREDSSVLPVDPSIAAETERVAAALADLLAHKLVKEVPTTQAPFWREDCDDRLALVLTDAGCSAIGIAPHGQNAEASKPIGDGSPAATPNTIASSTPLHAPASKTGAVIALMQRTDGATLAELVAATGWLSHTTRAALTGLRKKGHAIVRSKRGDTTCYHIPQVA